MNYRQFGSRRAYFEYVPYSSKNPNCAHVVLSQRAYNTILAETFSYDGLETGGVLIGHIFRRIWYITDVIPPGINAQHTMIHFHLDLDFVNFLASKIGDAYKYKPTILGVWHRHPGSMDFFSQEDFDTIYINEQSSRYGILSMLVNIDPDVRMTFYHARDGVLMKMHYDQGDEYFPEGLLDMASPEELLKRRKNHEGGRELKIEPNRTFDPQKLPRTLEIPSPRQVVNPEMPSQKSTNNPSENKDQSCLLTEMKTTSRSEATDVPLSIDEQSKECINNETPLSTTPENQQETVYQNMSSKAPEETDKQFVPIETNYQEMVLSRLDRLDWPGVVDQVSDFVHKHASMEGMSIDWNPVVTLGCKRNHDNCFSEEIIEGLVETFDAWGLADGKKVKRIKCEVGLFKPKRFACDLGKEIPNGIAVIYIPELRKSNFGENMIRDIMNNTNGILPILRCYEDDYKQIVGQLRSLGRDVLSIFL